MKNIEAISCHSNVSHGLHPSSRFFNIFLAVYGVAYRLYISGTRVTDTGMKNEKLHCIPKKKTPLSYRQSEDIIYRSLFTLTLPLIRLAGLTTMFGKRQFSSATFCLFQLTPLSFIATVAFHRNDPIHPGKYFRNSVERLFDKARLVYAS